MNRYDQMDAEAPLPFVREKPEWKIETTKFVFEREKESTRTTTKYDETGKETGKEKETVKMEIPIKVTLKCFGNSAEEDPEHFFEAFDRMQKAMAPEWKNVSSAKDRNATVLFDALEEVLTGVANADWHDVMKKEPSRTWEMFKTKVAEYICTKVLHDDAYNEQIRYMQERGKPMKLDVEEWWHRFQTLNRYLPYFIPSMDALKHEYNGATFPDWWTLGSMREAEVKRTILSKAPKAWNQQLKRNDVGHDYRNTKTTGQLVNYFNILEGEEKEQKHRKKQNEAKGYKRTNDGNRNQRQRSRERNRRNDYRGRQSQYSRGRNSDRHDRPRDSTNQHYQRNNRSNYQSNRRDQNDTRHYGQRGDYHRSSRDDRNKREENHFQEEDQHLIDTWNDQFNMSSSEESDHSQRSHRNQRPYTDNFFYDSGSEDSRDSQ